MADLDWNEIVLNPDRYPEEMLRRDLGDETAARLIALRQRVVPVQVAQTYRQRADVFEREKQALEQQLAYALAQAPPGTDLPPGTGAPNGAATGLNYETDPILAPIWQQNRENTRQLAEVSKQLADLAKAATQSTQMWREFPNLLQINALQQADPKLSVEKLQEFRRTTGIGDPNLAYRAMQFDAAVAQAEERGLQRGMERAKTELATQPSVPFTPYGPPQAIPLPEPSYQTLDEAEAAALQDPEIIGLWNGSLNTLPAR